MFTSSFQIPSTLLYSVHIYKHKDLHTHKVQHVLTKGGYHSLYHVNKQNFWLIQNLGNASLINKKLPMIHAHIVLEPDP